MCIVGNLTRTLPPARNGRAHRRGITNSLTLVQYALGTSIISGVISMIAIAQSLTAVRP